MPTSPSRRLSAAAVLLGIAAWTGIAVGGDSHAQSALQPGCGGPLLSKKDPRRDVTRRIFGPRESAASIDLVQVRIQRDAARICLSLDARAGWRSWTRVIVNVHQTIPTGTPGIVNATYNIVDVRLDRSGRRVLAGDYEDPQPVEALLELRGTRMSVSVASPPLLTLDPRGPFTWRVNTRAKRRGVWVEDTLPSDHETVFEYPSGRRKG
jgi:hypothetical protein